MKTTSFQYNLCPKKYFRENYEKLYSKSPNWNFYSYKRIKYYLFIESIRYINFLYSKWQLEFSICDVGWYIWLDLRLIIDYFNQCNKWLIIKWIVLDKNLKNFYNENTYNLYNDLTYIEKDLNELDNTFVWSFDMIISSEVIEHLWDIEKELFFINLNKNLKQDWLLLLSAPNWASIFKNVLHILNKNNFSVQFTDFKDEYHHKWTPTVTEVISLLSRKWFFIYNIYSTCFWSLLPIETKSFFKNIIFKFIVLADFFLINLITNKFILGYLFSATLIYSSIKKTTIDKSLWYNDTKKIKFVWEN